MRQLIPEVQILNESGDALQILRALWETDAFDSLAVSDEDRMRHRDYSVRAARDVRAHEDDLGAFLESLEMAATIEQVNGSNLERVATMLGKTNQFNLTTRRHSRAEIQQLAGKPGSIAIALRLRDKFGEQGIVGVLLAEPSQSYGTLNVDTFLVSCRALGRGVEDALWAALISRAIEQKVQKLEALYIPTAKNAIVADLYDRFGLQRVEASSSATRYVLEPIPPATWPSWILNKRNGK
jgi:FkbH-like protein